MPRKWLLIALGVVIGAIAVAAVVVFRPKPQQPPARAAGAVSLPAGTAANLTGFLRPQHVVTFGTTLNGSIIAFLAEVGDQVFQEQVLARIGSADLETARESAQRAVDRAQERVDRAQDDLSRARLEESRSSAEMQRAREVFNKAEALYSKYQTARQHKAVAEKVFAKSEEDYQSAREDLEVAETAWRAAGNTLRTCENLVDSAKQSLQERLEALDEARKGMDSAEVKAPVDGYIVARNGQVGQSAQETGEQMFQIATDFVAMEFTVEPPADVLKTLKPGKPALVLIPELTDAGIPGQVKSINGSQVVIEFVANLPAMRPGMKAGVRL